MRRYRRNGNPIGDYKVYVVMPGEDGEGPVVWEIKGCRHWEEVPATIDLEAMSGTFGPYFDARKAVIVMPGSRLRCNLGGADLHMSNLSGSDMRYGLFLGTVFEGSDMAGVDLSQSLLKGSYLSDVDLSMANLEGSIVTDADMRRSLVKNSIFKDAELRRSNLESSDLEGSILQQAMMEGCNLRWSNLKNADLRGASLEEADLGGSYIMGADFTNATRLASDHPIPGWRVTNGKLVRM